MCVLRRDVETREYRSVRPRVLRKNRVRKQLLLIRNVLIVDLLKNCSGRVRNVFAYCVCLYISLQFYDCEALARCVPRAS